MPITEREVVLLAMLVGTALSSWWLLSVPLAAQNQEAFNPSRAGRLPPMRGPAQTVSADLLRHPISSKTRGMLQRALDWMRSGKHREAIHQLEATLAKDPSSAAYVHSLLGFEYMQTDQFAASVNCFEQAVSLLPHDAINHVNFGISLAGIGDYKRAEEEARRALDLAPGNAEIQRFLDALLTYKRTITQRQGP
jgi:tetratricopeptide (TPR) repeat protein